MASTFCIGCKQEIIDGEVLCIDCRAGRPIKEAEDEATGDLDKEMLISALRHAAVSKSIVIQRLMHALVEKEDKIIELQVQIEQAKFVIEGLAKK